MGKRTKIIAFSLLALFFIGGIALYGIKSVTAETKDLLEGYGSFEGTQYENWTTFSETGGTNFSQDGLLYADGSVSAKQSLSYTRNNQGEDTAGYEYVFAVPSEGMNSVTLNFSYMATVSGKYSAWKVGWEIIDWERGIKDQGTLPTTSSMTPYSATLSGLEPGHRYTIRLYHYLKSSADGGCTGVVNWDAVKVNIDYNHSAGPLLYDFKPGSNFIINGIRELSLWAWDPAGIDNIRWEYSTDEENWKPIGSDNTAAEDGFTYSINWNTEELPDGTYHVRVTGTDKVGKTSTAFLTFKLENQGPKISGFSPAAHSRLTGDQALSVRVQDPSGVKGVTWEYSVDGGEKWIPLGTKKEFTSGTKYDGIYSMTFPTEDLPDGNDYLIRVTAVDNSYWANQTTTPGQSYSIDNNPPEISLVVPQMWSYLKGHQQTLEAKVTDDNGISQVRWRCSTNEGDTWEVIGSASSPNGDGLFGIEWDTALVGGDGVYLIEIRATNSLGIDTTKTFNYYIDNTAPVFEKATAKTRNMVDIEFDDMCMNSASATNPANYLVYETDNPSVALPVTEAILKGDQRTIRLTVGDQQQGKGYTVEVFKNITDAAGNLLSIESPYTNKREFVGLEATSFYPHGNFDSATELCASCHITHAATGPKLLLEENEKLLCFTCHDASGISTKNVLAEFGSVGQEGANTSHHGVPEGLQSCIDCHNPHDGPDVHYPKLLSVKDGNENEFNSANDVCFGCHGSPSLHGNSIKDLTGIPGVDDHESYYTAQVVYDGDRQGAHVFKNNGADDLLAPPNEQSQINCNSCHVEHGSWLPKLLRDSINGGIYNVEGNNNTLCYACHENPMGNGDAPYLGKTVFESTYLNAHGRKSSGVLYPGGPYSVSRTKDEISDEYQKGNCINCHNPHGTPYGKMLVDLYQVTPLDDPDAGSVAGIRKYNALCFKCHDSDGPAQDIAKYYSGSYRQDDGTSVTASGHYVHNSGYKIDGKEVPVGYCIPCNDCHNPHGSANDNNKLLNDKLGSNLYDGTTANQRGTCLRCHTATDDEVQNTWRGNLMPKLPNLATNWPQVTTINQHARNPVNPKPCSDCHGYGDPVQAAHAPEPYGRSPGGKDCDLCHSLTNDMGMGSNNYRHLVTDFTSDYNPASGTTCVSMCHTDHNVFNQDNPPTFAGTDPGKHLRVTGGNTDKIPTKGIAPTDKRAVNELCMSCHSTNQDNPDYFSPGGTTGTTGIKDFVYGTDSWHPIMKGSKPNNYINENTANPPWDTFNQEPDNIMACTDCHSTDGTRPSGPHSSGVKYMLKRVGPTTSQGVEVYDALCVLCHKQSVYGYANQSGNGFGSRAPRTHSLELRHYTVNAYGCYGCHAGNSDMLQEVTSGREKSIGGGALRGSIHGRTYTFPGASSPTEALIHGNLISQFDPDNNSCVAKIGTSECQMNSKAIE